MESFETIMSLVNDPDEYKKKIDGLNEKIKKADEAVVKMYAEQSQLNIRQEEVEEAIAANHKAKSEAIKAIEYEEQVKKQNTDILRTLQSKQSEFDKKLQELKQKEKEVEDKIKTLKYAQHNLDQAKEDFKNRVALIESRENKILEFIKTIS